MALRAGAGCHFSGLRQGRWPGREARKHAARGRPSFTGPPDQECQSVDRKREPQCGACSVAPAHPDRTEVRFLLGLAATASAEQAAEQPRRLALPDEAIAALRAILIDHPGLVGVRLELARAFFLKGEDGLSWEHFESVLAGKPPAALVVNIRRFLQTMQARRRWSGYFGFALAPDTNIQGTSDTEYIYIHGLPFRRDTDSQATSGIGFVLWGGGEYNYLLNPLWRLLTGVDVCRKEYPGERFDQSLLSVHLGPRLILNSRTELKLLGVARGRWLGGHPYTRDLGIRFGVQRQLTSYLGLSAQAAWYQREYQNHRGDALDGPLQVRWQNSDIWGRLEVNIALPKGFALGGSVELHRGDYQRVTRRCIRLPGYPARIDCGLSACPFSIASSRCSVSARKERLSTSRINPMRNCTVIGETA